MSEFVIKDTRTTAEKAAGKRSEHAHDALARAIERDPRMANADCDAFMALEDRAQELIAAGDFIGGEDHAHLPENKTRSTVPGRDDLEFVRGNGVGGCRYLVISRVPVAPMRSYVQVDEDELEENVQTVSVKRLR